MQIPEVTAVEPNVLPAETPMRVIVHGRGFAAEAAQSTFCRFGACALVSAEYLSSTQIACLYPGLPGNIGFALIGVTIDGASFDDGYGQAMIAPEPFIVSAEPRLLRPDHSSIVRVQTENLNLRSYGGTGIVCVFSPVGSGIEPARQTVAISISTSGMVLCTTPIFESPQVDAVLDLGLITPTGTITISRTTDVARDSDGMHILF